MSDFKITMAPCWGDDTVSEMKIQLSIDSEFLPKDAEILRYPSEAFGGRVVFSKFIDLKLADDLGEISYEVCDVASDDPHMLYKGIFVKRELQGKLQWSYRIFPRVLPEKFSSSPYYDFRSEPFGLNGSGYFTFLLPNCEEEFQVTLRWDMSAMPKNARAIWSYGEGEVTRTLKPENVAGTMFQVGVMNAVENDSVGIYWFGNPEFDIESVAKKIPPIFDYMKNFFGDSEACFRVFLRRDPFKYSGGGSACQYAFISGYSAFGGVDLNQWFNVLLHEMTHTWTHMKGEENEVMTWFNEGATEYYCTMIPFWGGFLDAEYTASVINDKVNPYYHNIYREMPNKEIPKIQWQDLRAQVVPYGRGFLYLANVEAQLKREGKGSINDVVVVPKGGTGLSSERWRSFVREKLGDKGIQEFEDMADGKLILPEEDIFGPEFEKIEKEIDLEGRKTVAYQWKAKKCGKI